MTELTTDIIEKHLGGGDFCMTDKDDGETTWKMANGIEVFSCTMCGYEVSDADNLQGLGQYLYIETEEDLARYNAMTYKEVCITLFHELVEHDIDFPIEDYVELSQDELDALNRETAEEVEEISEKQKLIDKAIEQMKYEISMGDVTAIDELLSFVPDENLLGYLSEL